MPTYRSLLANDPAVDPEWTFPAYRHLLSLEPSTRFVEGGLNARIQPIGVVATAGASTVGLALACVPEDAAESGDVEGELLSVVVSRAYRGQGVGSSLVAEIEKRVEAEGRSAIKTIYMTGSASDEALEGILRARSWSPPELRMLALRARMSGVFEMPWFDRYRMRRGFEIIPWVDVTAEMMARLRQDDAETGWIAEDLRPWNFDDIRLETASSLGVLLDGVLVGWVINHTLDERTVRTSCGFLRPDLSRHARMMPVLSKSLRRARDAGFERWLFAVPIYHREMVRFTRRWCAPHASFLGETRSASKRFVAVAAA